MSNTPVVQIYTDGACSGNPGPGGWGVLLRWGDVEKELSGGEPNWRTADGKPVKNVDLWQRLQAAMAPHRVEFIWVRGHNGHPDNERVDRLAVAAVPQSGSAR